MAFIEGIVAICLISIIAINWDEIKRLFRKKKPN